MCKLGLTYSHTGDREVVIQEGESLENALRRFKRKVQSEDIIKEIKKHSYYMKPGERRRAKEALSRKRLRKKQRREQDYLSILSGSTQTVRARGNGKRRIARCFPFRPARAVPLPYSSRSS